MDGEAESAAKLDTNHHHPGHKANGTHYDSGKTNMCHSSIEIVGGPIGAAPGSHTILVLKDLKVHVDPEHPKHKGKLGENKRTFPTK